MHVSRSSSADVDLDKIAGLTPGFTGADLANLVNEAAIAATRRNADAVALRRFHLAIERIVAGIEKKSRVLNPKERRRVAYHEMGHALVAPACRASIRCTRSRSFHAASERSATPCSGRPKIASFSLSQLQNRMAVLMGGRAAEILVCGDLSTGAADDLAATDIARRVCDPLWNERREVRPYLAQVTQTFLSLSRPRPRYSEATSREIDLAVRDLIEAGGASARVYSREAPRRSRRGRGAV